MRIMGIDPGAYTGIAVLNNNVILHTTAINMTKIKGTGARLRHASYTLVDILRLWSPDIVYCEEPFIKFRNASKAMNKLLGIFECACEEYGCKIIFINPSVVKKIITGDGKADKLCLANALIERVKPKETILELIGQSKFDETDAIAIAISGYTEGNL